MSDIQALIASIKIISLCKDPKQIKTKASSQDKINLFWVYKDHNELKQFNVMIKEQYMHKLNLIKCSKLDSLSELKETDNSIILLNEIYKNEVMDTLGKLEPMILIYTNELNSNDYNQFNATSVCFMTKSQKALIKYFKQLLQKPQKSIGRTSNQKYSQALKQLPKLLRKSPSRKTPIESMSARHLNDNWKYPSPTKYSPEINVIAKKTKIKLAPFQK